MEITDVREERAIRRGDIYYIQKGGETVGCEQRAGRPAIIISNNTGNQYSPVIEVVYLTTGCKTVLPTHVDIRSSRIPSTALCEQIFTADKRRLGNYIGHLTTQEQEAVDRALMVSIGLDLPVR